MEKEEKKNFLLIHENRNGIEFKIIVSAKDKYEASELFTEVFMKRQSYKDILEINDIKINLVI